MSLQNTQQNGNQPATTVRKQPGPQRVLTRASMTTEYQARFLPPGCHRTIVTSSTRNDPYHPLKGTSTDKATLRSFVVTRKWIKLPPKPPQPSLPPKSHRRCSSAPHNPVCSAASQVGSKVDFRSTYTNDFQAWDANKRQPYKLVDCLKVNQGLVVPNSSSKGRCQKNSVQVAANSKAVPEVKEAQPLESVTSYRSDYVSHPVQPRTRREKPAHQTKGLLEEPAVSLKPKASPPAGQNNILSTSHADYRAHKCPRTKPVLPLQTREKSKEPLQTTTTMREAYKAWDTPKRFPQVRIEELDWSKKTTFSLCTPQPAESCKTNQKPFSIHPRASETAVSDSSCNATKEPQRAAEDGEFPSLDCISPWTEESRMYWKGFQDRAVSWANGGPCEEHPEAHQIISCMVSSRS